MKKILLCILLLGSQLHSQIITNEDSLNAGLRPSVANIAISGYGEMKYHYNATLQEGKAQVVRNVLFIGSKLSSKALLFSELELENSRTSQNNPFGSFSLEQLVLKLDISRNHYVLAGLYLPRIGFMNENHLPITFHSNDRPLVETLILPSTWREIGVCLYGTTPQVPGLHYSVGISNGMDASKLQMGSGLRDARGSGYSTSGRNMALNASLLYYINDFRLQASTYLGGSVGMNNKSADSLGLQTGLFGTPISVNEMNAMYKHKGITAKVLGAVIYIPQADKINAAFTNNTANLLYGFYGEISYDLLYNKYKGDKTFNIFTRYEKLDLNASIPINGIANDAFNQHQIVAGASFQPFRKIIIKFDYTTQITGEQNNAFIINPYPQLIPYDKVQHKFNLGIAYSF